MLLQKDAGLLLVIDVQTRLVPVIHDSETIVERCAWVMDLAKDLHIPTIVTEQYPQGLGPTIDTLRTRVGDDDVFTKNHFSCLSEPGFSERIESLGRKQVVVVGMEAHVCAMQTILQLCDTGWQVFAVVDALGSREPQDKSIALKRMQQAGATLVTSEMLFFEWLRKAGTEQATQMLRRFMTGAKPAS